MKTDFISLKLKQIAFLNDYPISDINISYQQLINWIFVNPYIIYPDSELRYFIHLKYWYETLLNELCHLKINRNNINPYLDVHTSLIMEGFIGLLFYKFKEFDESYTLLNFDISNFNNRHDSIIKIFNHIENTLINNL